MNTDKTSSGPSQSFLQKIQSKVPSNLQTKAVALLAGWGLIAAPNNAIAQGLPSDASVMTQQAGSLSEVRKVEKNVTDILEKPPVDALRTEALQILNNVRKQRSFNNTQQQERFFYILAALDQNVSLDKAVFVVETEGAQYLKLAPRRILKEFKIDSFDLSRFVV